ncbi:MAG: Riboflavin biosynthesis protein RibF [Chlamydiae bacterium]|nr:Riboflavin biosynthesis protein RibF [Chlamydiota bacterium]
MILKEQLEVIPSPSRPCALTIGTFDGLHLGHQRILKRLREKVGPRGTVCVVTFSNHPSHVLPSRQPVPLIFSKGLKINMLEEMGVDVVYCLEFTSEMANKTYGEFLQGLKAVCPFDFLVLGEGATFGKKGEGTAKRVVELEKELGFSVEYLSKLSQEEEVVSSGVIRRCILEGDLERAAELLGHPVMIELSNELEIAPEICIPPDGNYRVIVKQNSHEIPSILSLEAGKATIDVSVKDKKTLLIFH